MQRTTHQKTATSGKRGRPVNAYRFTGAEGVHPPQPIQLLAKSLAGIGEGAEAAHRVGREFGSTVGGLDRLGSEYKVDDESVHTLSCMFESGCAAAREVVCGLHAGLIEGATAQSGRKIALEPRGPDGLGGCTFELKEA